MKRKEQDLLIPRSVDAKQDLKDAVSRDLVAFFGGLACNYLPIIVDKLNGDLEVDQKIKFLIALLVVVPLLDLFYRGIQFTRLEEPDLNVVKEFNSFVTVTENSHFEKIIPLLMRTAKEFRVSVEKLQTAFVNGTTKTGNRRLDKAIERLSDEISELKAQNPQITHDRVIERLQASWQKAENLGFKYSTFIKDVNRALRERAQEKAERNTQ